jgi:hypothetical protein
MSKLAEAYGRSKHPKIKDVKGKYFRYSDLGNCYSYVTFGYEVNKKEHSEQIKVGDFFEWIGSEMLKNK